MFLSFSLIASKVLIAISCSKDLLENTDGVEPEWTSNDWNSSAETVTQMET